MAGCGIVGARLARPERDRQPHPASGAALLAGLRRGPAVTTRPGRGNRRPCVVRSGGGRLQVRHRLGCDLDGRRAGGRELGHLAAPPRTPATLEGLLRNLERARAQTGALPLLENVASLIDPPGSSWDEAEWLDVVLRESSCGLLLDLHNLHANAANFGFDPLALSCPASPDALAQAKISLPGCAADPNKDGSDIVCYAGQSPGKPAATVATTKRLVIGKSGPDLTAQPGLSLLRRSGREDVQWGGKVTVKDALALSTRDGKCYFGLHVVLVNAGSAPSGPFEFSLSANGEAASKRASGPLLAGATGSHDLYANLRPGLNTLRLSVDSTNQAAEAGEDNNVLAVTVTVEGTCGAGRRLN